MKLQIVMIKIRWAFLGVLALSACGRVEEQGGSVRRIKVEAYFEGDSPDTRVSLTPAANSLDLIAAWQENDAIKVYLSDGANYSDAGYERLESISDDGKRAQFHYSIPADFNSSISTYQLFCFSLHCYPIVSDWELYCNGSITRSPLSSFHAPVFFESGTTGSDTYGFFRHYGVYELLHVSNNSDKAISFSLLGFSADRIWYRSKGAIKVTSMEFVVSSDAARTPVDQSPAISIPAHGSDIIVSWFIPNGGSIEKAILYAEIDGENVHTANHLSSQVVPQIGHAYHMYVAWDGKELRFDKAFEEGGSEISGGGSGYGSDSSGNVSGTGLGYGMDDSGNITGGGSGYGSDGSGVIDGGGSGYGADGSGNLSGGGSGYSNAN